LASNFSTTSSVRYLSSSSPSAILSRNSVSSWRTASR